MPPAGGILILQNQFIAGGISGPRFGFMSGSKQRLFRVLELAERGE